MPPRLEHQVAMITGAASGIGLAIARRLADDGATVVIADINEKDGREAAEQIGAGKAVFQPLDVTSKSAADTAVAATLERFRRLDIHVNNAGIVNRAPFLDYGLDAWRTVLEVNLTGAFICGQASARAMADAGGGRIINIASVSGQFGGTGRVAYGASKAGIISLTQTMAMELGPRGITVNAIAPGPDAGRASGPWPSPAGGLPRPHGPETVCPAGRHRRRSRVSRVCRRRSYHWPRAQRRRWVRGCRRAVRPLRRTLTGSASRRFAACVWNALIF